MYTYDVVLSDDNVPDVAESTTEEDSGSTFKGYAAPVSNINDVASVRRSLLRRPEVARSSHLIYAYRIQNSGSKVTENFDSGREWGAGLELLKKMKDSDLVNMVCLATRTCGPHMKHIGKKRFDHINNVCMNAVGAL
jgi:putative IMPACT (imprinted ancient) family translation regulator